MISDAVCMQDINDDVIESMVAMQEYSKTDSRDGKRYIIQKFQDGSVWMKQNLDLDIGGANTTTLTSENTDISANGTVSGTGIYTDGYSANNGVYTWTPSNTAITSNHVVNWDDYTVVEGWGDRDNLPYSAEGGDAFISARYNSSDDELCLALGGAGSNCNIVGDHSSYDVGNYYSWTAAVASNNSSDIENNNGDGDVNAANSICPKGWGLPSGGDFTNLLVEGGVAYLDGKILYYNDDGFNLIRGSDYKFIRSGEVFVGYAREVSSRGEYWINAVSNTGYARTFAFNQNGLSAGGGGIRRSYGYPIRCRARTDTTPVAPTNTYTYTLNFDAGADGDVVTNMPQTMTYGPTDGEYYVFTVPDTIPIRKGYTFKHWIVPPYNVPGWITGPGGLVQVKASDTNQTKTATAVWEKNAEGHEIVDGGDGIEYALDSGEPLVIKAEGDLSNFTELRIDGLVVPADKYTKTSEGSQTVIMISPEYLSTLPAGDHTITLAWTDGEVSTSLKIAEKPDDSDIEVPDTSAGTPNTGASTGDNIGGGIAMMILPVIMAGLATLAYKRNANKAHRKFD